MPCADNKIVLDPMYNKALQSAMLFQDLSLNDHLQERLKEKGYENATEIQQEALPIILDQKEVIACAKTGSGKTLAFVLPLLHLMAENKDNKAFIIAPTRELALQIQEDAEYFSKGSSLTSLALFGGADYEKQKAALKKGPNLIVATPGRALDFLRSKDLDLSAVKYVVLDEADRMLDMGFIDDVKKLLKATADDRVVSLFSATLDYSAFYSVWEYMTDPQEILINPELIDHSTVTQEVYHLGRDEKLAYLIEYLKTIEHSPIIIFSNTKNFVESIALNLQKHNIASNGLSSTVSQSKRIKVLKDFKDSKFRVLVATDVASRGLHVEDIALVINYDIPQDPENYVHRIGRTARAGKSGTAISFCSELDYNDFSKLESYLKYKIPVITPDESLLEKISETKLVSAPSRYQRDNRRESRNNRSHSDRSKKPKRSERTSNTSQPQQTDANSSRPQRSNNQRSSNRDTSRNYDESRYTQRSSKQDFSDMPQYPTSSKIKKPSLFKRIKNLFAKKQESIAEVVPAQSEPSRKPSQKHSSRPNNKQGNRKHNHNKKRSNKPKRRNSQKKHHQKQQKSN